MIRRALLLIGLLLSATVLASCVVPPATRAASQRPAVANVSAGYVDYGPGLVGDLYLPRGGGNRGTIILVHGGGFITGARGEIAAYSEPIFHQLDRGFSVLNIDYRLTTDSTNFFPAAVADVSTAVDWVRRDGARYGLNPAKVIVAGHSAGATLAALIGLGANDPGSPRGTTSPVDGWIAISGIYDMRADGVAELQRRVWLGPDQSDAAISAASALTLVDGDDPPGYVVHGAKDPIVSVNQAKALFFATAAAGGSPWLDVVADSTCDGHVPTCAINTTYLDAWTDKVLAGAG